MQHTVKAHAVAGGWSIELIEWDYNGHHQLVETQFITDWTTSTRVVVSMVKFHVGENYSPVWQGRGWTVEVSCTYDMFRVS